MISKRIFALIIISLLSIFNCNSPFEATSLDQNKDGIVDNKLYTKSDSKISIFMESYEFQKETPDDWTWLKMDSKDPKSFQTFYNEIASKNPKIVDIKIWFGPDNLKLIEKNDKDLDGFFETTQYYNRFAKPKVTSGIIAKIEIDSDKDLRGDIWIYPMQRIELDTNKDGIPDKMSSDIHLISDILKTRKIPVDLKKTSNVSSAQSWVIHPELISDKSLKATIPFSL